MSQDHVRSVQRVYQDVTASMELSPDLFDREMVLDARDVAPDFGVVRGREASQEQLRGYWGMFDGFHVELGEVIHADETHVVNVALDHGRAGGSAAEVENRYFHAWTFAGGMIVRLSIHSERDLALAAVGLEK